MHSTYQTHGFDLGVYTQIVYLYSQGNLAYSTIANITALANHFEPILILIAPIYKLFPSPNTLLILQALAVALSTAPIYLLANKLLHDKKLATAIALYYGTSSGLIFAIHWDFHTSTLAVLPLTILLYSYFTQKWKLYVITFFCLFLFKEDLPIYLAGFGMYQIISKKYKIGIFTVLTSLAIFYLVIFQISPNIDIKPNEHFTTYRIGLSSLPLTDPTQLIPYLLTQPSHYLPQLVTPPVKLNTAHILFAEYLYLPLASPLTYLTVFPYLFLRFTSNIDELWVLSMHYNANFQPFLAVSTILVVSRLSGYNKYAKYTKYAVYGLMLLSILKTTLFLAPQLSKQITTFPNYQYLKKELSLIPNNASIAAQDPLVPHLANRQKIYLFPDIQDAEYIILDDNLYPGFYYSKSMTDLKKQEISNSTDWAIINKSDKLLIYKRINE